MSADTALSRQRQRCVELRRRLRAVGDAQYDPDWALIRRFSPYFARFTGHTVAQQSLEYALLLLYSDDRIYGTDDAGEANRIIRKTLEYQDLRPESETYGNFFWMTHWDRVKDRNAVSFLASGLVHAYLTFSHKLQDETRAALERAFPVLLAGIRNHKVRWQYTNIYFLNIGGLVSLARVLDDPTAHVEALRDFDTWLAGTAEDGVHEFNSPTYTPVTLFGMEAAWANTTDPQFRERLHRTMDLVTYQLALNLFPNGFLGGAPSRAYHLDAVYGSGWSAIYAHLKFGTQLPPQFDEGQTTMYANLTLFDYVPPEPIRNLAIEKSAYAEIHDRVVSLHSRRTHVMTPSYSLSSQSMDRVGGHSPPAYVLVVRHSSGPRRSVPLLPDESFSHLPCARFQSRQTGHRLVGRWYYELTPDEREKFSVDPTYVCEPRALFGRRSDIREVRIGNVDWAGAEARLLPGQTIAISYGDLYLGLMTLPLDREGRPTRGHVVLAYGDDDELRLRVRLVGGPDFQIDDEPLDVLLLVDVTLPSETLANYADWLAEWQLRADVGDRATFAASHPDGTRIAFPYSPIDPDPMGDALHVSPSLTLRPGDLRRIVDGEVAWELHSSAHSS